jgi:LmbE family N-acetylglucosaminyl deacetylase
MRAMVIVAHPDDETLWAGGTILRHPDWEWLIISLCRSDDPDRAPRFQRAAERFGAEGLISDLDDSPRLMPLSPDLHEIKDRIIHLVPGRADLVFTHGKKGEYTRHLRHEQVHAAVVEMVEAGDLSDELLFFAYDDCGGRCRPAPYEDAQIRLKLRSEEYLSKQSVVKHIYGFEPGSFEYEAAGPIEAFNARSEDTITTGSLSRLLLEV